MQPRHVEAARPVTNPHILRVDQNGTLVRMSKLLRGLAAGWGAKKLGGGCLSTIIIFVVLWYLLGHIGIFR